ncbi:hypothetical protein GCM10010156_36480 [Planobispora rosea]|uniref:Uncharacterized protein n=1 Tax=Planobispora rosea TaxID=35762 RepID=A0A8J3WAE8_PLARO|nr:hypothetical protein [Planobispora rosea]GGS74241.1 hypothetical protein GCM10010156_36480 [Planobispora rosea]GIH81722.1 hypothetical protein Pro02_01300 [Planobispora rosea]
MIGQVIARAAGTCQCRADSSTACGRPHKSTGGTCLIPHLPERPLHIVPRADVRPERAAALPAEEFMALCDGCHAALLAMRRKSRVRAVPVPDALF